MKKKIVIKRKTTGKHAYPQDRREFLALKADFLSIPNNGAGITDNYSPQNLVEPAQLVELKKNYYVEYITPKKNRSNSNEIMRNYFKNDAFIELLFKWVILYAKGSAKNTIEKISTELAITHQNINTSQIKTEKKQDLEAILEKYAPKLIYAPRKSRWWEDQLSKANWKIKFKKLRIKGRVMTK